MRRGVQRDPGAEFPESLIGRLYSQLRPSQFAGDLKSLLAQCEQAAPARADGYHKKCKLGKHACRFLGRAPEDAAA
jgi:hypothetical protein